MMTELEADLIAEVIRYAGNRPPVTLNTRLYHDARLYGDDLWQLIEGVSRRWRIDFSGMNFSLYAPEIMEWDWPWPFNNRTAYIPISVSDLVEVIEARAWSNAPSRSGRTELR